MLVFVCLFKTIWWMWVGKSFCVMLITHTTLYSVCIFVYCECYWSFRRFTYGNLVTTSPSSKCSDLSDFGHPVRQAEPASQAPSENFIGTFIGRSDGRCVQRAGTYSMRADDSRLQGIPRCMTNNCKGQSQARRRFKRLAKTLSGQLICSMQAPV